MSAEQQIEKLQGLLERVQKNAALPRQPAAAAKPMAAPAPEPVAVQASEPVAVADEPLAEDVDLLEDDIVDLSAEEIGAEEIGAEEIGAEEIGAEVPIPQGPEIEEDIFFEDEEEIEPPASSRRPKVAASMDEALAGAAELELEREVPLKTPPPESGRQVAGPSPQGLHQSAPPADLGDDVDALLEADISSGTQHARPGPTPEQLGQTIDLEEGEAAPLELEVPSPPPEPTVPEELEAPLPQRGLSGYGAVAPPPAEAPAEARREEAGSPLAPAASPPGAAAEVEPEVVQRPAVAASGPAAEFAVAHRDFKPESFLELLDASLKLGE